MPYGDFWVDRLHTRNVASPTGGEQPGGYSNPKVDEILDRLGVTIAPAERLACTASSCRISSVTSR